MTARKLEQIIPQTSIVVRRVFRIGENFMCGICRVQHKNLDKATRCLNTCWRIIQHGPPFIPFRKLGKLEYACVYCMRSFVNHEHARSCAEECSTRLSLSDALGPVAKIDRPKRSWMLQSSSGAGSAVSDAEKALRDLEAADAAAAASAKAAADRAAAAKAAAEKAAAAVQTPAAPVEEAANDENDPTKKKKVPKDRTKKFERHGSKYVCIVCNEKYFTKDDVEACWDKHD